MNRIDDGITWEGVRFTLMIGLIVFIFLTIIAYALIEHVGPTIGEYVRFNFTTHQGEIKCPSYINC